MAKEVETKEQIAATASISAADPQIGEMIAEAMDKVGKEGVITVEESNTFGLELELTEGMRFDKGYISRLLRHRRRSAWRPSSRTPTSSSPTPKISAVKDLLPMLEKVMQSGKPLRHHRRGRRGRGARDPGGQQDPRHLPLRRRQGSRLRRPPQGHAAGHRDPHRRPGHLRGGRPQARERRLDLLGAPARSSSPRTRRRSSRVPATPSRSRAGSTRSAPRSRSRDSDYDREKLQERLAKLAGGVAVIKAGAATEVELKERKHRIEDAVRNAKAAVEEGIVAGGGVALLQASKIAFEKLELEGDEARARNIVEIAVEAPLKQIAINAGLEGGVVAEKVRNLPAGQGLNAATGEYVDLIKAGHHRPGQGDALRAAERGVDRRAVPHHRGRHRRQAGEGGRAHGWRRRRHGRHGLLIQPPASALTARTEGPRPSQGGRGPSACCGSGLDRGYTDRRSESTTNRRHELAIWIPH